VSQLEDVSYSVAGNGMLEKSDGIGGDKEYPKFNLSNQPLGYTIN